MASIRDPDVNLIHFILRLMIAVGSFLSAIFKIPFICFAIQFVINYANNMSRNQQPKPDPDAKSDMSVSLVEIVVNFAFLTILFISVMVILIRTVYIISRGMSIGVYGYLIIMGIWIVFIISSITSNGWKGPLNYAVILAKVLLTGWFAVSAPSLWHFIFLRISIIIDIITYPSMIGLAILNYKYSFLNDRKIGVWTRYNNLIRTL